MGVQGSVVESPIGSYVHEEFDRVLRPRSSVIYLHQILQLNPPEESNLDLHHLATLWKMDGSRNGCLDRQELDRFAEFCNTKRLLFGSLDFEAKLKAQCAHDMWEELGSEQQLDEFADWICLLVCQGEEYKEFPRIAAGVSFLSRDSVMTLYELMAPYQIDVHTDQQGFLDMLQQIGEAKGLMPLNEEALDDWVPVEVVRAWARQFIQAYIELFKELGLEPEA
jgi:hypothetical protein